MFSIDDYRQLPQMIKSLATRYWVAFIMRQLGAKTCYQIWGKITPKEDWGEDNWVANKSRFWNLKKRGDPVVRRFWILKMEKLIPGSQQCLIHPLWQLLAHPNPDKSLLTQLLKELDYSIVRRLFVKNPNTGISERSKKLTNKQLEIIGRHNSLDSLTCLLASNYEEGYSIKTDILTMQTLICLLTHTSLIEIKDEIYNIIYNQYFSTRPEFAINMVQSTIRLLYVKHSTPQYIPIPLLFTAPEHINVTALVIFYLEIIEDMISLGLIEDTLINRMIIHKLLYQYDLGWLLIDIERLKNGEEPVKSPSTIDSLLKQFNKTFHLHQ